MVVEPDTGTPLECQQQHLSRVFIDERQLIFLQGAVAAIFDRTRPPRLSGTFSE